MIQRLSELKQTALRELEAANDLPNLESWRVRYLGRKSELTKMLRGLAELTDRRTQIRRRAGEPD